MNSIGEQLKQRREMLKISLEKIHQETHISLIYLEALENEKYDVFPAEVYLIGFLKKYALYLGLHGNELVGQYRESKLQRQAHEQEELHRKTEEEKDETAVSIQKSIFLAAIIFLGVGICVSLFLNIQTKPNVSITQNLPDVKRFLSISSSQEQEEEIPLEIIIIAKDKNWMRIKADGALMFEGFLPAAAREEWKAMKEFSITSENWDNVSLLLNGYEINTGEFNLKDHFITIDQTSVPRTKSRGS